ncbi:MAG: 5'/3'-nucleotidase SurE [Acidimicrobiales bacterium]
MRVLVTNDDGVRTPGIAALAMAVVEAGHDVVVAAPCDDRSGASAAIGGMDADETIEVEPVELAGLAGVPCYAVSGAPALIVIAASLGGFGPPPALVTSGINPGLNTGRAVLHSGTVGAALSAANLGRSGLAVSLGVGSCFHWSTAASLAVTALDWLAGQPARSVINLNVPNVELEELRGVRDASLAPFGTVRAALVDSQGTGLQVELAGEGEAGHGEAGHGDEPPPDSDTALVQAGWATTSFLTGIGAIGRPEVAAAIQHGLLARSG